MLTRLRGVYLRKLNLFTVRQIASKVNTAFLSLWAVCVLLFFSITVFSSGMGLVEVFVGGAETGEPLFRQPGRGRMVRARRIYGLVIG